MRALLQLLRVGTLFSPAADITAGLCLAGADWSPDAARTVAASVGVYAAGMVLNDVADRGIDATHRPERPIPSGAITPGAALALGSILMIGAVVVAPAGGRAYYALLAALVLAYDFALKRHDMVGALNMGLLRGLNLAAGAVVLTGTFPRVVAIAAGAYAIYIIAVTLLGIMEDHKNVKPRAIESVQSVPPLCASLALLGMPQPWPAAAIAMSLALLFLARNRRINEWDRAAIRGSMTALLLGTMIYTSLLCLSAGRVAESLAVAAAIVPARWISRRISLT